MKDLLYEKNLIDKLIEDKVLSKAEFSELIGNYSIEGYEYIKDKAVSITNNVFGNKVYIRGLIEFSNFCHNDCYYCGIRRSNTNATRYRLSKEEILECCASGYEKGFRTFVLQSGEDLYFDDDILCDIISSIKYNYHDCAVTMSVGERSYNSYKLLYNAGADRYLLRHETANENHYCKLHPENMSLKNRKDCLFNLKEIGYQVGAGFMVGSPYQTSDTIAEDLLFLHELKPHMVGIGPFISHKDTPFNMYENGTVDMTLFLLSVIRVMLPKVLLPATTALSTLDSNGRIKGILSGANVIMPNISPEHACEKYKLYDNKLYIYEENGSYIYKLKEQLKEIGYEIVIARGDSPLV